MRLATLVQAELLVTGPARPRGIGEQARIARMVRARRAARASAAR
jgi:hypothetical protein